MTKIGNAMGAVSGGLALVLAGVLGGCGPGAQLSAIELPSRYNTPDGMCLDADGSILLSVPNFNEPSYPPKVARITPDDEIETVVLLTGLKGVAKAGPLGIGRGADGHIYISDNPDFGKDVRTSRLLRVVMRDGKAERVEVVATGFYNANGLVCHGDSVYVCECKIDPNASPLPSGVVRFKLSELDGTNPVALQPGGNDPHFILKFHTKSETWKVGANGLAIHGDTLYVCNFGDGQILRAKLREDGTVGPHEVFAEGQGMVTTDGLSIDRETGDVYVADFAANAVHRVDAETGAVTTIARNGNTDGTGGALDRPSEPCVRGRRVYVANIDLPLTGNEYDEPHTISVIELTD